MTLRARRPFVRVTILLLFVVFVLQFASSQTIAPVIVPQNPIPQSADNSKTNSPHDIRVGAGDLLEIRVFGVPEMNQDVRVSGTGEITVALVGSVTVKGLTVIEAQKTVETRLKDGGFLKDPHVSVFVKDYATQGISVLGEVQKPGIFPMLGARRLYDAISLAGGTTNRAGKNVTITRRDQPDKPIAVEVSTDPSKSLTSNVEVLPGDTIVVSKAGVIYVVGDVSKPAGFTMDNNEHLTVLQAIALAGGTNSTAALDRAKIIRKSSNGLQEIPMPLKRILSAKADDISMQPEDILFVPSSAAKSAARRGAEAILQITTGIAVYRR